MSFATLLAARVSIPIAGLALSAHEMIGPVVTLLVWFAFVIALMRHDQSWIECVPIAASLVILQLLLDLHTRHLGDIIVATLHVPLLVYAALRLR